MYELRFYTCSELFLHHLKNILNTSNIPLTEFVSGFGQEKRKIKTIHTVLFLIKHITKFQHSRFTVNQHNSSYL
jgi:hypothetical protein